MGTRVSVWGGAAVAAEYAEDLLLGTAREVHRAIAKRIFDVGDLFAGGRSLPRRIHDGVSTGVYTSASAGLRVSARGLRAADRHGIGPALEDTPQGRFVVSAVNGLIGDRLADGVPEMAIEMAVRLRGRDVPLDPDQLAVAFPAASDALVVFLHGLSESEEHWYRRAHETGGSYGERLALEEGWSPVYLRINTGLPLAENGVALSSLLDRLVAAWPTPVRRIALVGHSMGGLILRAGCAVTTTSAHPWTDLVTDVVTLGTPHLGAPLERAAALGARALGVLPESAPFGRILEYRSTGILDLANGLARDVQNLPHAKYHLVAATLASSPHHPVSEAFGDLLVRYPSATGRSRRGTAMFPEADVMHVPNAGHFELLNHDDVYAVMRTWLRHGGPARRSA